MSSRRTISSRPPESVTKLVTGGLSDLARRRCRCVCEDLFVRDWRCCCASMKKANDTSTTEKKRVRLSIVSDRSGSECQYQLRWDDRGLARRFSTRVIVV